ncbi:MAG TPA: amidophosphoribosyltransferase [Acidobacteria bacterium]|nr:amidophosphoribosyltransferase [Acidobacteriota bacterium]
MKAPTTPRDRARWRDRLVHLLLPAPCLACGTPLPAAGNSLGLCPACHDRLRPPAAGCAICSRPLTGALPEEWCCASCRHRPPAFDRLLALWSYEEPLDAVIQGLKFRRLDYLGHHLGTAIAIHWQEILSEADLVVPVPLHWWRRITRGYNQSERIARAISRRLHLPFSAALVRCRRTPPQTSLGRTERLANLQSAFRIHPAVNLRGKRVILVDDVATTGATLEAAASVLRRHGATAILATVAGKTPLRALPGPTEDQLTL